jgi:predicted DNA binding CopG/RHH family protein
MAGREDLGKLEGLGEIEDLGDVELDEATHREARRQIAWAERDIARMRGGELQLNIRWSREQVDIVKQAAALHGMPYQTYLKQAAIRQAIADLKDAKIAGVR